ncbi:hypothetical protein B6U80_01865 [Candidatus Pacearchaeota archaeon ex4484_26]|nr:MAG: hypothetical protein B6U80_01865 [Candidatus Pacearchaeota archaeon ex4484_26]
MKKKLNRKEKRSMFLYIKERFGLGKEYFKDFDFFKTRKAIYITTKECLNSQLFKQAETAGIAFLRPNKVLKPTTNFLQLFGKHASKNVITLSREQAERFIRGEDLELDKIKKRGDWVEPGYVIVKYQEHILGCANFKEGVLKNMIAKSRRRHIKEL